MNAAAGPTTKLSVEGIRVCYGSTVVLDDFSLQVADGETVAVIGPSGSGKSTLLRAIAGLEPLVAGRIMLDHVDMSDVAVHRRGLGLMFQDHALFPHLSVADNIGYGLARAGLTATDRQTKVEEVLDLVGLSGFGARSIDQLSGGEAQRVALARALAPTPGLLMLDEPLGSLDRVLRDQLIDDLDLLLHRMGQTSLHVTHDQTEAFALADRVAVLAEGELVALGTPKELWDDPKSRFVAEFLGRPNIWTLTVDGDGSVTWIEGGLAVATANQHPASSIDSATRTVVVPVEALHAISPESPTDPNEPTVAGTIVASRFHQGRYRHRLGLPSSGGNRPAVVFVDDHERAVGERVELRVDLDVALAVRP